MASKKTDVPEVDAAVEAAPEVDARPASEILASPGKDLTYGEILALEARAAAEAAFTATSAS